MKPESCPDRDSLEKLLLGRIATAEAKQLEEHLLHCDSCSAAADTVTASDELTEAIRKRRVLEGDDEILAQAIERGKQLRAETETAEFQETMISGGQPEAPAKPSRPLDEEIDFLAPPEQPDELGRLGDYRVLDVLGIGGMGVVFRAEDPKLERIVALKAMKPAIAASKSAKDRFVREAKATASIEHDNIVQIYQVGEDRGIPFIAMRFLRGESLLARLKREQQLTQPVLVRIGREVAAGLTAAHKRGLIHRDIKPDNIWLEEETDRAKILDFGLVRSVEDEAGLTQSGMIIGTPRYMAPEQAQGEEVDHRCDLFSLGSVLYHLAGGQAPFDGKNVTAMLMAVAQADPTAIDHLCPSLHPELAGLIMQLLSKDRDARPQTAAEVKRRLAKIEKQLQAAQDKPVPQGTSLAATVETAPTTPVAATSAAGGRGRSPIVLGGVLMTLAIAVLTALWAAGIILKVETPDGTLVVKVTGENFATTAKGKTVTIENTATKEKFTIDLSSPEQTKTLPPGDYKFLLTTASGLKTRTDSFTITGGKNAKVEVWWEPKGKPVAAQEPNYALSFDGKDDSLVIEGIKINDNSPLTIDVVLMPRNTGPHHQPVLLIGDLHLAETALQNGTDAFWNTFIKLPNGDHIQSDGARVMAHRADLLSIVFSGNTFQLFVNGIAKGTLRRWKKKDGSLTPILRNDIPNWNVKGTISIGAYGGGFFNGIIDEVRISNTARYTKNFKPEKRFKTDKNTLALYHFDSGSGTVLKDSSGNGHHGKIVGANWVKVDDKLDVLEYVWPKDQPAPAIAPFNAKQAKEHQAAWAKHLGVPVETTNSIGMKFRVIPPGEFLMGSSKEEIAKLLAEANKLHNFEHIVLNEGPQHRVTLTKPFALAAHEATRGQFRQFVEATGYKTDAERDGKGGIGYKNGKAVQAPGVRWNTELGFKVEQTDDHPVVNVSWNDAVAFCKWLSKKDGVKYRLATEAEWEFACRAGSQTRFSFGDDESKLTEYAWFGRQGGSRTNPVGRKTANAFGVFDMHGNVSEWCHDYGDYGSASTVDPAGPRQGKLRTQRGGSFVYQPLTVRSAYRIKALPDYRIHTVGFRIVRTFEKPKPVTPYARDRAAAEWVLSIGGTVGINLADRTYQQVSDNRNLPPGEFSVVNVKIDCDSRFFSDRLRILAGLPSFIGFEATGKGFDKSALRTIMQFRQLANVNLRGSNLQSSDLGELLALKNLAIITLGSEQINDQWAFLAKLPTIRELRIIGSAVPAIAKLEKYRQLRTISLRGLSSPIDASLVVQLQLANSNLRMFAIDKKGKPQILGHDPTAEAANILSKRGWKFDYDVRNSVEIAKVAIPRNTTLTDEEIRLFPRLNCQFTLMAGGLKQADRFIPVLVRCHFRRVNLNNSDLTDKGLESLSRQFNIKTLEIVGTKVTKAAILAFKRKIPTCVITSDFGIFEYEHRMPEKPPATTNNAKQKSAKASKP